MNIYYAFGAKFNNSFMIKTELKSSLIFEMAQ